MWLRWIGEQIAGAVGYIEAEERAHNERLLVTTEELETARSRIRCLEQDLERVTRNMAQLALTTQIQVPVTPVSVQNKGSDQERDAAQAQELVELKDELAAQEALRS